MLIVEPNDTVEWKRHGLAATRRFDFGCSAPRRCGEQRAQSDWLRYGVRGEGGADTAVARDTTALNTNPAGLVARASACGSGHVETCHRLDSGRDVLAQDQARCEARQSGGQPVGRRARRGGVSRCTDRRLCARARNRNRHRLAGNAAHAAVVEGRAPRLVERAAQLADGWTASGAFEYQLDKRAAYSNPNIPLGSNAEERTRYIAIHVMLGRRW
jgi:hypothetical protein